jgi:hypothetical protein
MAETFPDRFALQSTRSDIISVLGTTESRERQGKSGINPDPGLLEHDKKKQPAQIQGIQHQARALWVHLTVQTERCAGKT